MNPSEALAERRPSSLPVPITVHRLPVPADGGATDERINLREIVSVLRRHRWLIALSTIAITALSAWLAYTRPNRYESAATVRIADVRQSLTGGLGDDPALQRIAGSTRDPLLSQMEVLYSRTMLGAVVDDQALRASVDGVPRGVFAGLSVEQDAPAETLSVRFTRAGVTAAARGRPVSAAYGQRLAVGGVGFTVASRPAVGEAKVVVSPREHAIGALLDGLKAQPRERTDLFDLSYTALSPVDAQRVLQSLVETFQAQNAGQAQQESRRRRVFIEAQLRETDSVLSVAQTGLSEFRRQQRVYSTRDQFSAEQSGLMDLEVRREELVAERQTAAALVAAAERRGDSRSISALVSSPAIASNPVIAQLYTQLVGYESTRDSLTTGQWRSAGSNPDVQRLNALVAATQTRIADAVRSQLASLDARLTAVDALRLRRQGAMESLPGMEAEELRLTQQVTATQAVADQLRTELQKARIAEAVEVGQVEVVDRPSVPSQPISSHRGLRVLLGLVLGLGLGCGAALLRENLNTTIRRREDVEDVLQVANLAVIPQISANGNNGRKGLRRGSSAGKGDAGTDGRLLVTAGTLRSSGAEAYRTLRTNLMFSQARNRLKTIVITSAGPAEGKSTTSANLAATFAQQGMRVVLVDCDLRRPRVHEIFGLEREPGLTQLVLGFAGAEDALRETPIDKLWVLPSGTLPPNPSELLGSEAMGVVLANLRAAFDIVILDSPPVLLTPDSSVLASSADGVLMVVRVGQTDRAALQQASQQLRTVGGHLVGSVLNDPDAKIPAYNGYYAYGSGYGYYGDPDPDPAA